jgi:hypothetical protein
LQDNSNYLSAWPFKRGCAAGRGEVMDALFGRQTEPTELVDKFVAKCSDPLGKPAWVLGFNKLPQF